MQLIIKDNKVVAIHPDNIRITQDQYPGCEIIFGRGNPGDDDPRTEGEKKQNYKDQRRLEYPTIEEQLDLMYWDQVNGTAEWQKAIKTIKDKYPKVE